MRLTSFLLLLPLSFLLAQQGPAPGPSPGAGTGAGGGVPGGAVNTNPGGIGGGLGGNNPTNPRNPFPGNTDPNNPRNPFPDTQQRPIFISGKVMLEDGTPPPDSVTIERVCNGVVRPEGYTNSKGHFSFELGRNNNMMADASTSIGIDDGMMGRNTMGNRSSGIGGFGNRSGGITERELMGCEIRANLPGFRGESVNLAGRRSLDNPDIGTIILRRLANVEGYTFSMTTALAPKEAKKNYDKGLDLIKKQKYAEALAEIEKATAAYPKYAVAWFDQGRLYELQKRPDDAAKAFEASIAADPKYVKPYVNLAMLHGQKKDWSKTAEVSAKGIRLNPFEYPQLHYVNAVSNLNLGKLEDAEKAVAEASKLDTRKQLPQLSQLASAISAQRQAKLAPPAPPKPATDAPATPPPPPAVSARTSWPSWSNGISDLPPGTLSKPLDAAALAKEVAGAVYALHTAGDASQLKPETAEFHGAAVAVSNSLLVTNCDVMENSGSTGLYQNGKLITTAVRLVKAKRASGLCVLEVRAAKLTPVSGVRYAQDLTAGEKTYTVRNGALAEGTLQAAKNQGNIKLLVSNAPVTAATAGGGLFDNMGNLLGVTTLRSQTAVIAIEEFFQ